MKRIRLFVILFMSILLISVLLRQYKFIDIPRKGATFDEYAWTWLGMNILQRGVPLSWSPHPQYQLRTHYIEPGGARFWLVQPYLEHPPLFGLIAGGWALLSGAKDMYSFELIHVRPLALVLGFMTVALTTMLATQQYGKVAGILSGILIGTVPTMVIGSRLVQNENFFIPLFLCILLLLQHYIKQTEKRTKQTKRQRILFYAITFLCGVATLAKVPWWAAGISVMLIYFSLRRYRDGILTLLITGAVFSLFFLWGWRWDAQLFTGLWKLQLARYDITFDSIYGLFISPLLVDRFFLDGWIYAGWFSFFTLLSDFKRHRVIILGLLGYFIIYSLAIPNEPSHGWYRYPFYPFLLISLAYTIKKSFHEKTLLNFFLFALIGTSLLQVTWAKAFGFSYFIYRFVLIGLGLTAFANFFPGKVSERIGKVSTYGWFILLIGLNIWTVVTFVE